MYKITLISLITILFLSFACDNDSSNSSRESPNSGVKGWNLVWSDEFEYEGLPDSSKWGYDIGGHGWGNQELQHYTANRVENAWVKDGRLFIQARKERWNGNDYTSARLRMLRTHWIPSRPSP